MAAPNLAQSNKFLSGKVASKRKSGLLGRKIKTEDIQLSMEVVQDVNVDGVCPECNHSDQLTTFIPSDPRAANRIARLRAKLAQLEKARLQVLQQIDAEQKESPLSREPEEFKLDDLAQQALTTMDTHDVFSMKVLSIAMIAAQNTHSFGERVRAMGQKFGQNQEYMLSFDKHLRIMSVYSKVANTDKKQRGEERNYRQARSFESLAGARLDAESANILRVWFHNSRGYLIMILPSEIEARTVMQVINTIVNSEDYRAPVANQIVWAAVAMKKGKRMRRFTPRFVILRGVRVAVFKSFEKFMNNQEPSDEFSLLACDLPMKHEQKQIKFKQKGFAESFLNLKLTSEAERDDFATMCGQVLMEAVNGGGPEVRPLAAPAAVRYNDEDESESDEDENEAPPGPGHGAPLGQRTAGGPVEMVPVLNRAQTQTAMQLPVLSEQNVQIRTERLQAMLLDLSAAPRVISSNQNIGKTLTRMVNKKRASEIDFIEEVITRKKFKSQRKNIPRGHDPFVSLYKFLDCVGRSMIDGAFLSENLFITKAIWNQKKIEIGGFEEKVQLTQQLIDGLNLVFFAGREPSSLTENPRNVQNFLQTLSQCEQITTGIEPQFRRLLDASQQQNGGGIGKIFSALRGGQKVVDNAPLRRAVQEVCGFARPLEQWYTFLSTDAEVLQKSDKQVVLRDLAKITQCLGVFANVLSNDAQLFLRAYIRRGGKNLFQ